MQEIKCSAADKGSTATEGLSVILINHHTNEVIEFPYFILVGFDDGGEYVSNCCTMPQAARGLFRIQELYDELKAQAKVNLKRKLVLLPAVKKDLEK